MNFKSPEHKYEAEAAKRSAEDAMEAMAEIAEAKTPHERKAGISKLKLVGKVLADISRLPKRAVLAGVMVLKAKIKREPVIIRSSPSTDYFYEEAPQSQYGPFLELSNLGDAWRLADSVGGTALYNHTNKEWLNWDGRRWNAKTGTAFIQRKAAKVAKNILEDLDKTNDYKAKGEIRKWALKSQSQAGINSMIALARSIKWHEVYSADFDKDPWLFNCLSGTINLRTGRLQPHSSKDNITKLSPVEFPEFMDKSIRLKLWYEFLDDVTDGDKAFQKYLQQITGYSLTGDTSLDVFFLLIGGTKTGKSTFIDAIKNTLGDYAQVANFDSFLKRKYVGGTRDDLAAMEGTRLVVAVEVDEGKRLAEGLVKSLSGGDTLRARHLYGKGFEFKPQFKLWLAANSAPKVSDKDEAMWERIRRLPFTHFLSKKKRNPEVKKILGDPAIAGPTILFWAVEGCLAWQENPKILKEPKVVRQATQEYRQEMAPLKTFFEDYLAFSEEFWCPRPWPFDAYKEYCRDNGIRFSLKRAEFNERLEDEKCFRGRKNVRKKQIKVWFGVKIQK